MIVSNRNVWSSAIRLAEKMGWIVEVSSKGTIYKAFGNDWIARKKSAQVVAATPIEMLGLIQLHDAQFDGNYEPYWWEIKSDKGWLEYLPSQ